jgi:gliding motility-associated-like protein
LNGCTGSPATYSITINPTPISNAGPDINLCSNENGVFGSDPKAGYTYSWSPSTGLTPSGTVSNPGIVLTNNTNSIVTSTYTVSSSVGGCLSTDVVVVNVSPQLSVTSGIVKQPSCKGSCDGQIGALASPSTGSYAYSWNNGVTTAFLSNACSGSYTVSVTDVYGCISTSNVTLTEPTALTATVETTPAYCDKAIGTATIKATGGTGSYQYSWSVNSTDATCSNLLAGSYSVLCTDSNGCTEVQAFTITNGSNSSLEAQFSSTPEEVTVYDSEVKFIDESQGAVNWKWYLAGVEFSDEANPQYTFPDTGSYPVTLIITNENGCIDSTTNIVYINPEVSIYIPNAFTPNSDGLNDFFAPRGKYIDTEKYSLTIYSRWGNKVFESTSLENGWNGKIQGSNLPVPEDVYIWQLVARDSRTKQLISPSMGQVTVIR